MKKYLFVVISLVGMISFVHAEEKINECMSDIYFANGINTSKPEAYEQLQLLIKKQVLITEFNLDEEKMAKTVNFKLAYNNTLGIAFDLLESYGQKKAEHDTFWWTLGVFYDVYGGISKVGLKHVTNELLEEMIVTQLKNTANQFIINPIIDAAGLKDLASLIKDLRSGVSPKNVWATLMDSVASLENYDETKQLGNYKNSIKLGHSVIVIAHSQGNLFTNVVYDKITTDATDKWMTKYFYMIGVASPAGAGTGPKGIEIVTFDNDPITNIPDAIGERIHNPTRSVVWDYSGANPNQTRPITCMDGQHYAAGAVPQSCVDPSDPEYDFWSPFDNDIVDFHLFTYYMNTNISKTKILDFVSKSLDAHAKADTQWITDQASDKNTCAYKITLKHRFDTSIEMAEKVYPFNVDKKLYNINGEWVKASCGGEHILDQWDGKKENECWMIDNPQKEKIAIENNQTILPYNSVQFVLLRRYYSNNFFADCIPLIDAKIAITADGKLIKIIEKSHQESGTGENTSFISSGYGHILTSYNESVFFQATTLQDLESKVSNIWHLTVPKYTGWSGVGAVQCPLDKETISYQFSKDDLDSILK